MSDTPDPVDIHVGRLLRLRRKQIGQTQQGLADTLGVSFQQIQKYERGANRISASMLHRAATAQGVQPGFYFEGLDEPEATELTEDAKQTAEWLGSSEAWPFAEVLARMPHHLRKAALKISHELAGLA